MVRGAGMAVLFALVMSEPEAEYRAAIERWRQQREADLRAEDGWLSVTGLFWLEPGENSVGSGAGSRVLLPPGAAPQRAGVIVLEGDRAFWRAAEGVEALVNGRRAAAAELRSDAGGAADVVSLGRLKLLLLKRGERYAVRLKDPESAFRRNFTGLRWYPVSERWRVRARWLANPGPRKLVLETVIGVPETMESAGVAEFEREGRTYRLEAVRSGERLFFVFRDGTSGKSTYAAGRFLYADAPREGAVLLDFNKAYNPPCAFTPYATCPLPPPQNRLALAITAGEMTYAGAAHP